MPVVARAEPPPEDTIPFRRPFSLGKLLVRLKYLAWVIFAKGALMVLYVGVISEGQRQLIPTLGQKLHKLPLLAFLENYEATYELDMAPFFSVLLLIAVMSLWHWVLEMWLSDGELWESARHDSLVSLLAFVILGADAIFFYASIANMGWSASFSFTALVATAAYVGVLIFVSLVSVKFRQELQEYEGR